MPKKNPLIIIGLGNPGEKYESTRHNAGFLYIDHLAHHYGASDFTLSQKFDALTAEIKFSADEKIIFVKPQTFMNNSGKSTKALLQFYKAELSEDVVVIHDDLDLEIGKWKISQDRGAAGHNGILSIIEHCASKNFLRIRIGIDGRTEELRQHIKGSDYVLGAFTSPEQVMLKEVFTDITKKIESENGTKDEC